VQSAIEGNKYGGVLYGVPFDVVAPTIVYNKTLFQKAGVKMPPQMWTWDQFAKTAVSVSKALGKGYWGTEDFSGSNEIGFELWLRPKGKHYVLANGKLGFAQADLTGWYRFWDDLRKAGGAPPGTIQAQENPSQTETSLLAQGKAAMFGTLTPQFINIKAHMPDSLDLHMVPNGFSQGGMRNQHFLIAGYSASIARSSKHQDVAASIINFILNDPQASKIYFSGSRIPCSAKTRQQLEKSLPSGDPKRLSLGYVDTVAKDASSVPYRAGSASLTDLFSRSAQSVALGQASIDAAAKSFFSQAPQYLTTS
jgi:multiple sugar transport system substrate-binding protein